MNYDIALQAAHAARRAGFLEGWGISEGTRYIRASGSY